MTERFGPRDRDMYPDHEHVEMLNRHYAFLMEDQIDTNRFGRTEEMLNGTAAMTVAPAYRTSSAKCFGGGQQRQLAA
ncbi:MAG: hypothetical protein U5K38_09320 [Woeseiaceae bacterium]|nr:hypothetical protein [Woeseiaceae bacterium]